MLRLRSCVLTHLLSSHPAASPLHRLLSAAASPSSAFAVEQYLVDTCRLTRAQALKASTKLSHVKSPTNPDAVLAHLAGLGLSSADIAALVDKDPKFLCAGVERNLAPTVVDLTGLGLSRSQIACLVSLAPAKIRRRSVVSRTHYYLSFFGTFRWSDAELITAVSKNPMVLKRSKETLESSSKLLVSEIGLEPAYIARRPSLLNYSLEGRIRPRYHVLKFLKGNGLLDRDRDYYSAFKVTEKVFVDKYICPHNEVAPHLVEDYAAACRGEVPTNFRFA